MTKRFLIIASTLALAAADPGAHVAASPTVYPTGTTIYDPTKAYNSFIAFSAPDGKSHVIDMNGHEVHRWDHFGFPAEIIDPAKTHGERGHVVLQTHNGPSPYGGIFANEEVSELDWEGRNVWRWSGEPGDAKARQNHDWDRLANGNTLLVTTIDHPVRGVSDQPIADQEIKEVNPKGRIVWRWTAGDHIDEFGITSEGRDLLRKVYGAGGKGNGFLTINDMQPIGPNRWFDAGDKRFAPDNIVIDSREASFIAIIEKKSGRTACRHAEATT